MATRGFQNRSWRGHGNRGRSSFAAKKSRTEEEDWVIPKGKVTATLKSRSLSESQPVASTAESQPFVIANEECVGSYNWLELAEPTIVIPGAPPRWTPPAQAPQLKEDAGKYFRDSNAAYYPKYPSEPLVHAVTHVRPDLQTNEIDIVGCGSTLGNILRFVRGLERSFYIKAEKVGNTLFLVRQEKSPKAVIEGVYGYGHTFPEAYTTWNHETKGSASHQRLMRYELGGLKLLVRSEADGYLPEKVSGHAVESSQVTEVNPEDLANSLEKSSVTPRQARATLAFQINYSHDTIPQDAVFDLKTRSVRAIYDFEDILPRLWLNRTPNFVLGRHASGKFEEPDVHNLRERVAAWEKTNELALKAFVETLQQIIDNVTLLENRKAGIWRRRDGPLEIRKIDDEMWSALPTSMRKFWVYTKPYKMDFGDEDEPQSDSSEDEDDSFLDF